MDRCTCSVPYESPVIIDGPEHIYYVFNKQQFNSGLGSGLVRSGLVWSVLVCSGLVWSGLVWSGLVWSGLVWSGLVLSGLVWAKQEMFSIMTKEQFANHLNDKGKECL